MTWHCSQPLHFCNVMFPLVTASGVCRNPSPPVTPLSIGSAGLCGPRVRATCLLSRPPGDPFLSLGPIQSWKTYMSPSVWSQLHSQCGPTDAYQALLSFSSWEVRDAMLCYSPWRGVPTYPCDLFCEMPGSKYFRHAGRTVSDTMTQLFVA